MKKMKKIIAVLGGFAAMNAGVSAQELKFDGYVNSGIGILSTNIEDSDTTAKPFGVDSESNGYRLRLNGSYTNGDNNIGVKFRLQSQRVLGASSNGTVTVQETSWEWDAAAAEADKIPDNIGDLDKGRWVVQDVDKTLSLSDYNAISIPFFYGWVKLLNDKITITGGLVDDSSWTPADWWWNDDAGEGLGGLVKASPVKGLDLGFGAYLLSQQSGGNNNALVVPNGNFANIVPKTGDVKYVYSGSFTLPEVFRAGATFRWKNKAGGNDPLRDGQPYTYNGRDESSMLVGDLRFLAVKDLTAAMALVFDRIEEFDAKGDITLSETFGYSIFDLGLGLNAVQFFYNRKDPKGDKQDMDPSLLFNLWGSYSIGKFVPRLDLVYLLGGQSAMANGANAWHRRGYANSKISLAGNDTDDYSVFTVRPSIKFNLNEKTFIEIGDAVNIDTTTKEGGYKKDLTDSGDNGSVRVTNAFYIDFKWSF
ncbi:MAG: hypothetical protein LBD37_00340 [Treponema sp.]|jgi:hypothetical protein|nr:hypothetical protein [Treponema sp.]